MEAEISAAIRAAVPGIRVYMDVADSGATVPFVVLQRVGGSGFQHIDTQTSDYEVRLQVAVWGSSRPTVDAQSRAIEAALMALQAIPVGAAVAAVDAETRLRGMRQDFYIRD